MQDRWREELSSEALAAEAPVGRLWGSGTISRVISTEARALGMCISAGPVTEGSYLQGGGIHLDEAASFSKGCCLDSISGLSCWQPTLPAAKVMSVFQS